MNSKGFFFFNFDTQVGLEAVLESGPLMIRKSPIILKKWSTDTSLCKKELTRIPVWVKLHDVPIQVFEDDGISLIATFIGKPIMLDSYTSSMCRILRVGVVLLGALLRSVLRLSLWMKPPRCNLCKIFGHIHDQFPKQVVSPPIVPHVITPTEVLNHDGFQTVGKEKRRVNLSLLMEVSLLVHCLNNSDMYQRQQLVNLRRELPL